MKEFFFRLNFVKILLATTFTVFLNIIYYNNHYNWRSQFIKNYHL